MAEGNYRSRLICFMTRPRAIRSLHFRALFPAEQISFQRLQQAHFDRRHHDHQRHRPGEYLIGSDQVRGLPETIADAARGADRFGDQRHAPTEAEGKSGTGKEVGKNSWQVDLCHHFPARHAQHLGELDKIGVDRARALPDVGDNQRHRRHEHDEDRGRVRNAEPDDGKDRPDRRRDGVEDRNHRFEKFAGALIRSEQDAERQSDERRDRQSLRQPATA